MATGKAPARARKGVGKGPALPGGLPFPVVAIGASAGGLAAFTTLLKALPVRSGMAFVLIQHLEPNHKSALASLLSEANRMPAAEVSNGMAVEPNRVYVIPPNKNMTIRGGALRLAPRSEAAGPQHPINVFFTALAEEQGNAAIGVVLSGTGSDGTYGLKVIKAAGGITFAQDPKTAQWRDMPVSAIAAGSADFVLSPRHIAAELARIGRHPYLNGARETEPEIYRDNDFDRICLTLRSVVGIDFRLYKPATVRRRIGRRMALRKIASLARYARIVKQNPDEAKSLADDIFIHVTRFFRDAECFEALGKRVLAKLCRNQSPGSAIRVWVPGCSSGEEVYSIAMLLLEELGERAGRTKVQIFGTDIQESAVTHARNGFYGEAAVSGVSPARLKRFFTEAENGHQIRKSVRDLCVFARHDLAQDPPFPSWISSAAGTFSFTWPRPFRKERCRCFSTLSNRAAFSSSGTRNRSAITPMYLRRTTRSTGCSAARPCRPVFARSPPSRTSRESRKPLRAASQRPVPVSISAGQRKRRCSSTMRHPP